MTEKFVVSQIEKLLPDKELCGRLYADLHDMLEACHWFVDKMDAAKGQPLDREQLESLLIDIEVNMLDHLAYHLDSLRKDLPKVLEAIGEDDADDET